MGKLLEMLETGGVVESRINEEIDLIASELYEAQYVLLKPNTLYDHDSHERLGDLFVWLHPPSGNMVSMVVSDERGLIQLEKMS